LVPHFFLFSFLTQEKAFHVNLYSFPPLSFRSHPFLSLPFLWKCPRVVSPFIAFWPFFSTPLFAPLLSQEVTKTPQFTPVHPHSVPVEGTFDKPPVSCLPHNFLYSPPTSPSLLPVSSFSMVTFTQPPSFKVNLANRLKLFPPPLPPILPFSLYSMIPFFL